MPNKLNPEQKSWVVYMLSCGKDDSLYIGITNDLKKRIADHNQGKGAKYTRARGPVYVVYSENASDRSAATKREMQLKKLTRQQKLALIQSPEKKAQ